MYPNHTPTVAVTPANAGTFGPIIKNLLGDASSTFFASPDYIGVATVTYTVGSDSKSGVVNISSGIVSLTFSGPGQHNVLKDNGTETYSTPHWSVGSVTSNTQSRVCYERGGTLTVSAGFVVANPGTTTGILRGVASSGGSFSSVVTIAGDGKFGVSNLACSQTVSAHVDLLHPLTIKWQVSLNGGLTFSR
jgi:hypothetical protein